MPAKPSTPPPTIAHLKAQGLKGVYPFCRSCGHSRGSAFEALGLPDATPFPLIARAKVIPELIPNSTNFVWSSVRTKALHGKKRVS